MKNKIFILLSLLILSTFIFSQKSSASNFECFTLKYNLSYGSRDRLTNGSVTKLQDFLREIGYLDSQSTGFFGMLTRQAVKDFQKDRGFDQVGNTGPLTRRAVERESCDRNNNTQNNNTNTNTNTNPDSFSKYISIRLNYFNAFMFSYVLPNGIINFPNFSFASTTKFSKYNFAGWYVDASTTIPYIASPVTSTFSLYSKWEKTCSNSIKVVYPSDCSSSSAPITYYGGGGGGGGSWTPPVNNPATTTPSAPSSLTFSNVSTSSLSLAWTAPTTGTAPITYRIISSPALIDQTTSSNGVNLSGFTPNTLYSFIVVASNAAGSATSTSIATTTKVVSTPPSAPTSLVFSNVSTSTMTLGWTPSTGTAPITYRIISSPALIDATTTSNTINLSGLTSSTTYSFTVVATNIAGTATSSSVATSTTSGVTAPSAPTNLTFSNVSTSSLSLNWTASATGTAPITYRVVSSPAFINATTSGTSMNISGLTSSTTYSFTVTATNVAGSATSSSVATTTTSEIVSMAYASNPIPTPDVGARTFYVGSGSGNLEIDGANFTSSGTPITLQNGDVIKINAGTYSEIFIHDISVPVDGKPVFINNNGQVNLLSGTYNQIYPEDLNNVMISGDGTPGIEYGFQFDGNTYRSITMEGQINNVIFKNISFANSQDYTILGSSYYSNKAYNPNDPTSYSQNLRFLNLKGDNISSLIQLGGGNGVATDTNIYGVYKNVEIAGVKIINSPDLGGAAWIAAAEKYDIHNNYVNNINANNNNHNGIFAISGNGKFYNNMLTNHQGNFIRAWNMSIDATGTVEIINNIAWNSRKYSGFEIQVTLGMYEWAGFRPVSTVKIYNNTVGQMNTEGAGYPGRLVDLYDQYGGIIDTQNNLTFKNLEDESDPVKRIFNTVTTGPDINTNNYYFATTSDAIVDTVNFVSKVSGVGATIEPFTVQSPAEIAPASPTGLVLSNVASTSVKLTWINQATGTAPIVYRVISSPAGINATTTANSINLSGLTASTSYSFTVVAKSYIGSATSTSIATTTLGGGGTVAPSAPTSLVFSNVSTSTLTLNWTASATGTAPITYRVISSPALINATTSSNSMNISGLTPNTSYSFTVTASNSAGSATSTSVGTTTNSTTTVISQVVSQTRYNKARYQLDNSAGTFNTATFYSNQKIPVASNQLKLEYANSILEYNSSTYYTGVDRVANNNITIKASVDYNGTLYPVYFGGSRTTTLLPGQILKSDAVTGLSVPAGAVINVRTYTSVPNNGEIVSNRTVAGSTEGYARYGNNGINYDYTDVVGAPGSGGNTPGEIAGIGIFAPVSVWGTPAIKNTPVVALLGDSIMDGDSSNFVTTDSHFPQILNNLGIPYIDFSIRGDSAGGYNPSTTANDNGFNNSAFSTERRKLITDNRFTDTIIAYGANDIIQGGDPGNDTDVKLKQLHTWIKTYIPNTIQSTLTPRSDSSDNWQTTTNQSFNTSSLRANERITLNNRIRTEIGTNWNNYLEAADPLEATSSNVLTRNGKYWQGVTSPNQLTLDGIHPSVLGYTTLVSALQNPTAVALRISTSTAPSAPTSLTLSNVGTSTLSLAWTAPATGTAPITYRVVSSPALINSTTSSNSMNISGLTPNTSYSFTVTATNSAGSATSTSVGTTTKVDNSIQYATTTTPIPTPDVGARIFYVGSGSGDLTIDGNNFVASSTPVTLQNGDVIKINAGTYGSISIKNISVTPTGKPVFINNNGQVNFLSGIYNQMYPEDLNNVMISGDGTPGIEYGIAFNGNTYRAISMGGQMNNVILKNISFTNVNDYVILGSNYYNNKAYNPSDPTTYSQNLRFYNLKADNTSSIIQLGVGIGAATDTNIYGVYKNVEVAGLQVTNSPYISSVMWAGAVENYDVHNNYISNINASNNNHNGIFALTGYGKFYNNLVQNHQGNAIRAWNVSIGNGTGTVEISNNIIFNSRRYSGFEIQVTPGMYGWSGFRPVSTVKIYNNTVGQMNTEGYATYYGRLLDVYNQYGATIDAQNNLTFHNLEAESDPVKKIFNLVTASPDINTNNYYIDANLDAVVDTTDFVSKVSGVGATKGLFIVK